MAIPLEDEFGDIIRKAQRGLQLTEEDVRSKAFLDEVEWAAVQNGTAADGLINRLAKALDLHAPTLLAALRGEYRPEIPLVAGVQQFRDESHGMCPNAFLAFDQNGDAIIFDTNSTAEPILAAVKEQGLRVGAIAITHTHADHVLALPALREAFPDAIVYASAQEPVEDAILLEDGGEFSLSDFRVEARLTWGHSIGGVTYVVRQGLTRPVAIVGDALFAGSMGGGNVSYAQALATNREKIFSLPNDTVICPGHGPMTSVFQEKQWNPFYPEFK